MPHIDPSAKSVEAPGTPLSPFDIDVLLRRYSNEPLVFRTLRRLKAVGRPLDCSIDIAAPLDAQAANIRKALLALVLEGFVVVRKHDGKTTYFLTTNAAARLAADKLLRRAAERGMCE